MGVLPKGGTWPVSQPVPDLQLIYHVLLASFFQKNPIKECTLYTTSWSK